MNDESEIQQLLIQELASLKQRISGLEEELCESEEKYQTVLENIEDGYFEVDLAGDFTSFNTSLCRILGYTKKEMLGMNYKVLTDAENVKNVFRAFNEIYLTGIPSKLFEWEAIRKDGAKKCVEVSVSLIVTPGEKPTRFRGIARDITDRKQAEGKLLESEEKYRNILESIEDGYFEVDIAGNLTFFNDSVCRMLGKTRAELMGMNNRQYTDKENSQILYQAFNEVFRTGEPSKGVTYQIIGKDGNKPYIESSVSLIRNTSGQPIGFRGIMRNINERKRAEEAIVLAKNDWENTFYNVTDMITIHDEDFNIVRANPAARALFGLQLQEGMPLVKCFSCYHGTENPPTRCASCQSLRTGKPSTVEMFEPYLNKHIEVRAMPRFGSDGRPIGLIHVVRDITERKRIEVETASLADIGRVIGSTLDIDEVYERMVAEIRKLILFDSLRVNLVDAQQEMLHVAYVFGLDIPSRRVGDSYPMQGTILDEVIRTRKGMILQSENPKDLIDKFPSLIVSVRAGLRSIMTVPLISRDELIGTLLLRSKKPVAYTEHDLHLAERIGMQIAGAIANAHLFSDLKKAEQERQQTIESLRKAIGTTIQVIVSVVEARYPYTAGHQKRSADLSRAIATEMGLSKDKIEAIRIAGSIHDIGKLSTPLDILSKPTKLSDTEFSLIKEHSQRGYEMLKDLESPWSLAEIVHQHHERVDGSGYPRNLKGDAILIEARILAVADVVEAMASHRPYRPALGIDAALNEIEKNSGIFYDDAVADACLRLFREKGFKLEGT